jgi:hypothetical protein
LSICLLGSEVRISDWGTVRNGRPTSTKSSRPSHTKYGCCCLWFSAMSSDWCCPMRFPLLSKNLRFVRTYPVDGASPEGDLVERAAGYLREICAKTTATGETLPRASSETRKPVYRVVPSDESRDSNVDLVLLDRRSACNAKRLEITGRFECISAVQYSRSTDSETHAVQITNLHMCGYTVTLHDHCCQSKPRTPSLPPLTAASTASASSRSAITSSPSST